MTKEIEIPLCSNVCREYINFSTNHQTYSGKIIKKFTQIGMSNHGETFVVILLNNKSGLFEDSELVVNIKDIYLL